MSSLLLAPPSAQTQLYVVKSRSSEPLVEPCMVYQQPDSKHSPAYHIPCHPIVVLETVVVEDSSLDSQHMCILTHKNSHCL